MRKLTQRPSVRERGVTFPFDPLRDMPFVISCVECDCDSPDSYDEAIVAGWTHITFAPFALAENFFCFCPEHRFTELELLAVKLQDEQPGKDAP